MNNSNPPIDASTIEQSIQMLQRYLDPAALAPLIAVLRELPQNPADDTTRARLRAAVDDLGVMQGAVLTYAPAIAALLSDHPFGSHE